MPYKDPEQKRQNSRQWYAKNRDSVVTSRQGHRIDLTLAAERKERKRRRSRTAEERARRRAYYASNPSLGRASSRRWEAAHPEEHRAAHRRWYEKNRTRILEKRKRYYQENKHRLKQAQPAAKRARTLRVYGLSVADYDRLLAQQGGRCAICDGDKPYGKSFHVDHCHATGRVRGLLCKRCNNGLGFFDDDRERMAKAIGYLQRNPTTVVA